MLNHPGESLVLQTDFLYMVERVDVCIDFLKNHVGYFLKRETSAFVHRRLAALQRGRAISFTLPTMHDESYDSYQNVLCRVSARIVCRHIKEDE